MKEEYEKNIIEKIKKEVKLQEEYYISVEPIYGEKISIDTIEYFNSIIGIKIYAYGNEVASYDFMKKILYSKRYIQNIELCRIKNKIVNDFLGYKKYDIKRKYLIDFENFKNEIDSNCNLTDYEISCIYELNR